MIQTIRNAWKIPELRKKIMFTVFALLIFRLGTAVPVPFVDKNALSLYLSSMSDTIFGMINAMSGGAFASATVFALGVQPYINSSIIIQLLTVAIPALERLQKEGGEEGRKKIAAITRYTTVAIALLQGFGYYTLINANGLLDLGGMNSIWAGIVIVLSFTAGSAFVMWLGEQITEFGIGNGISIILFAGIVSRVPSMVMTMWYGVRASFLETPPEGSFVLPWWGALLIVIGMLAIVVLIVFISNAERRLPVQYAKRMVGRKMYGGQSSHIPMKVNMSGVMPIIFAQSIASLPATIGMFAGWTTESTGFGGGLMRVFDTTGILYSVIYFLLILGFSYFYSTMQFNPIEVANNLKKNGGFIPGFRPGKPTADFISKVLGKITLFGAIYLSIIAIAPIVTQNIIGVQNLAIGGTSIIIVVSVALETMKALEAQMLMRHYKGFLE
ncbi:preprotein translocase subunit SecY [Intestinimonas sp.]|uniref:preprotein translocase subunit SecY n=1 Tax=Intestinimonas sp. TaxID=1965293 RepID=UPI0026323758|nr:preprotein translocase subunit SecY [Intestinimonas sp.]